MEEIDCTELYCLQNNISPLATRSLVCIDIRVPEIFSKNSILDSINIPIGEEDYAKEHIEDMKNTVFKRIVLITDDGGINQTQMEYFTDLAPRSARFILKGGFEPYHKRYPFLCTNGKNDTKGLRRCSSYPSETIPEFLYHGNSVHGSRRDILQDLGIYFVVNATLYKYHMDLNTAEDPNRFQAMHCPVEDRPEQNLCKFFHQVIEFVDNVEKKGGKVLIHCEEGVSRSTTLVCAVLMYRNRWNLKFSLDYIKKKRFIAYPNPGFIDQLIQFEKELFGTNSVEPDDGPFG